MPRSSITDSRLTNFKWVARRLYFRSNVFETYEVESLSGIPTFLSMKTAGVCFTVSFLLCKAMRPLNCLLLYPYFMAGYTGLHSVALRRSSTCIAIVPHICAVVWELEGLRASEATACNPHRRLQPTQHLLRVILPWWVSRLRQRQASSGLQQQRSQLGAKLLAAWES